MGSKDTDEMAYSVDSDQAAPKILKDHFKKNIFRAAMKIGFPILILDIVKHNF